MRFVHAILRVKPEKADLYERTFKELQDLVQKHEPGTLLFEAAKDPEVPNGYRVFEAYKDMKAVDDHTATDYYKRTAAVFVECLEGDHMEQIRARGLTGRAMYQLITSVKLERFDTF